MQPTDHSLRCEFGLPLPDDLLGINYYDENYCPDEYKDPSFAEIVAKLKELGA